MLIAQISDVHIAGPGMKTFGVAPMAENLLRCVEHINQQDPKPDVVLVTGDITNEGLLEETKRAANIFDKLSPPYYVLPGNHDDPSHIWSVFGGRACPERHEGFFNYVIEGHKLRLIALDSTIPAAPGGEICETRAAWLEARLSEAGDQPAIIFMHHPPVKCGVAESDLDGFIGADRLGGIVEKYPNIERLICGHIHLPAFVRWRGSVVSTAPSMGMQLVLDLTLRHGSSFTIEAPGYQLHHWSGDQALVTHTVYVRSSDGPYPFEERP